MSILRNPFANYDIFISYHSSYANDLKQLKNELKDRLGIRCFLAHQDIEADRLFNDEIIKALHKSTLFLYISTAEANKSIYCQQEIGMALALKKTIFLVRYKNNEPPKGFIANQQAIKVNTIDNLIEHIGFQYLNRLNPYEKKYLKKLGIKGFKFVDDFNIPEDEYILLKKDIRNDYEYKTSFIANYKNKKFSLKIAKDGNQELDNKNHPTKFPVLPFYFYSYFDKQNLSDEEYKLLYILLGECRMLDGILLKMFYEKNNFILEHSIFRDHKDEYNKLREKYLDASRE